MKSKTNKKAIEKEVLKVFGVSNEEAQSLPKTIYQFSKELRQEYLKLMSNSTNKKE